MAINVTYQVPTSLMQQQRQAERRAYNRQVSLMTMQQNFQREQTEANRQFQRETMQTAYDRQREKTADERAYQQELLAHKEGREDAIRNQALALAEKQRQEQQIQQAETAAWQDSERQRQALEKQFNYTDTQIAEMKQLAADEREAYQQYSQGLITPEQYRSALGQLRARRMDIMPETPKRAEETMSIEERLKANTWTDEKGNRWYFDKNGEPKIAMPPADTVSAKLKKAKGDSLIDAYKSCIDKDGNFNEEQFNMLERLIDRIYPEEQGGDRGAQGVQPEMLNTPRGYIQNVLGGRGQQQPMQQPMQQQELPQTQEEIQDLRQQIEEEANKLHKWKVEEAKMARDTFYKSKQTKDDRDAYAKRMNEINQTTHIPQLKSKQVERPPKKEEPKRQTVSVTFNGASKFEGKTRAWVNGKRLEVGDEMPDGGKITSIEIGGHGKPTTLTYELDGKKYTIKSSRNPQDI